MSDVSNPSVGQVSNSLEDIRKLASDLSRKVAIHEEHLKNIYDNHEAVVKNITALVSDKKSSDVKVSQSLDDSRKRDEENATMSYQLSKKLDELDGRCKKLSADLEFFKEFASDTMTKLANSDIIHEKTHITREQMANSEKSHADDLSRVMESSSVTKSDVVSLKAALIKHQSSLDSLQSSHESLVKNLDESKKDHVNNFFTFGQLLNQILGSINQKIDSRSEKSQNDLKALKDAYEDHSFALSTLKTDVFRRLDQVSLDASNSVARSLISDQQSKLMDKKIDNINLQIKKYELNK